MGVTWTDSAGKHGVQREDVLWAIAHAAGQADIDGRPGWTTRVWVGHPHAQTDRYIEVIAAARGSQFVIFHAMALTDAYRHLADEEGNR